MRESIEINKDGADTVSVRVRLHAQIAKEKPGMYVSYCPALDLYSQGATAKEARENIIEATQLFIESCFARGTLRDVLRECGFCLAGEKPSRKRRARPSGFVGARTCRIPAEIPLAYC